MLKNKGSLSCACPAVPQEQVAFLTVFMSLTTLLSKPIAPGHYYKEFALSILEWFEFLLASIPADTAL